MSTHGNYNGNMTKMPFFACFRLNNLVNELRLQLLGKLPTPSEANNEKLAEELEKERSRYAELLKKHKQVTEYLNDMLIENTNLCEKALLAEAAKEKIERKLNELTEQCNQTIENLNSSEKCSDETQRNSVVEYIKEVKLRLEDLQSVNLKTNEELIDHEIKLSLVKDENDNDKVDDDMVMNEDQAVLEEEKRAMGQVQIIFLHGQPIKLLHVGTLLANCSIFIYTWPND